jgi:hypothetical protein
LKIIIFHSTWLPRTRIATALGGKQPIYNEELPKHSDALENSHSLQRLGYVLQNCLTGFTLKNLRIFSQGIKIKVLGCAFITSLQGLCPILQLFSIKCVKELSNGRLEDFFTSTEFKDNDDYKAIYNCQRLIGQDIETGIGFDLAAFIFIIFQLSIIL